VFQRTISPASVSAEAGTLWVSSVEPGVSTLGPDGAAMAWESPMYFVNLHQPR
jgi:hypothetical protein